MTSIDTQPPGDQAPAVSSHERNRVGSSELSDEYRASVGAVMVARKLHDDTCALQGPDSMPAQRAREDFERALAHRKELRERYDAAVGIPREGK